MTTVYLPSSLRDLAGEDRLTTSAPDVRGLVAELESRHPRLAARVTDEQGILRPHVRIFVNGEQADLDRSVSETDEVRILPAISGGADDSELLVGTRKGLIVLRGPRGEEMEVAARAFEGRTVEFATYDASTGTYLASVTDDHFGPRIFYSADATKGWEPSDGPVFPEDTGASVERIWTIESGAADGVVYAGVAPAALFRSDDGGRTWGLNRGLWNTPGRENWQPGGGGLCLHSIAPWPGDPSKLAIAISAAGIWLTEDGGESWHTGYSGLVPRYIPEEAREESNQLCVHNIKRSPIEPETIYLQFHWGVYRSDDAGHTWTDIGTDKGLSSYFGFPMAIDPTDSSRAFVIPLKGDFDRTTPDGKVLVYETNDRGASWSPRGTGLPSQDAYLTVLRQAFCNDRGGGDELGLYFGATSGDVFGSATGGAEWTTIARHLPPVLSVRSSL
jgi:molybdopterin converting factor small subunit